MRDFFRATLIIMALALNGCTNFDEVHYFGTYDSQGNPANFFRLTITGDAELSSAKYISGYYDESAVDLIFDELKPAKSGSSSDPAPGTGAGTSSGANGAAPASGAGAAAPPVPADGKSAPSQPDTSANAKPATSPSTQPATAKDGGQSTQATEQYAPLDGSKNGVFVMIFSTNADAVADTIGSFAESNVTAQAVTNLVNQQMLTASQKVQTQQMTLKRKADATSAELTALFGKVSTTQPTASATTQSYLRVLSAISRALGSAQDFQSLDQAATWFNAAHSMQTGDK